MARQRRSDDWGFPRWRSYGTSSEPAPLRQCDRAGCGSVGDRPAPKAPDSAERWWFCEAHAAEYNRGWNYFAGLNAEDAAARAAEERARGAGYHQPGFWSWSSDEGANRAERDAFHTLELAHGASAEEVKFAYRRLVKLYHPDANPDDPGAAERFRSVQSAYDLLQGIAQRREEAQD